MRLEDIFICVNIISLHFQFIDMRSLCLNFGLQIFRTNQFHGVERIFKKNEIVHMILSDLQMIFFSEMYPIDHL